jgi:signal peptidase I
VVLYGNDLKMDYFSQVGRLVTDVVNKFRGIENPNRLVKRVIGLPGDVVNIEGGFVYVNDVIIDNDFIDMTTVTTEGRQYLDYPATVEVLGL